VDPTGLIIWTVFLVWLGTSPWAIAGYRRLAKRKPREEVDPWADWKAIKANLTKGREKEHADWQEDFDRLVRATCVHSYPSTGSKPTYYTCYKCGYEEPWEFVEDGCGCRYENVMTLSSPFPEHKVIYRYGNCKWHGIDYPVNRHTDRSNKPFKSTKELYG